MEVSTNTRIIALITFVVYSVFCVVLGYLSTRKKAGGGYGKSVYAGGGNMGVFALTMMIAGTAASGGTFLSNPGLGYSWGLLWPLAMFAFATATVQSALFVSKKMKIICERLDCVSVGVALKHRYSNSAFVGWYVPIAIIIFSGLFLYQQVTSGAKLMESITGLPYVWGLIIFGGVLIAYTIFGGSKSASIVSIFQGGVMTVTTIALIVGVAVTVRGSWGSLEAAFVNVAKEVPAVVSPTSTFGYPMLFSYLIYTGIVCAATSGCVSTASRVGNTKTLHSSTVMTMFIVGFWAICMVTLGTIGRTLFPGIEADTVIPTAALLTLPPVFTGIVVAGVASAIHSTLAVQLININASVVMDLYGKQIRKDKATDEELKKVNTISTVILIIAMVGFAMKPPALIGIINIFSVAGGACAFLLPILLGLWWKRANVYGCVSSVICSVSYYVISQYIKSLAFGMNAVVPSLVVGLVVFVVVSLLTPMSSDEVLDVWFGVGRTVHKK